MTFMASARCYVGAHIIPMINDPIPIDALSLHCWLLGGEHRVRTSLYRQSPAQCQDQIGIQHMLMAWKSKWFKWWLIGHTALQGPSQSQLLLLLALSPHWAVWRDIEEVGHPQKGGHCFQCQAWARMSLRASFQNQGLWWKSLAFALAFLILNLSRCEHHYNYQISIDCCIYKVLDNWFYLLSGATIPKVVSTVIPTADQKTESQKKVK